jgi:hypothetical protein
VAAAPRVPVPAASALRDRGAIVTTAANGPGKAPAKVPGSALASVLGAPRSARPSAPTIVRAGPDPIEVPDLAAPIALGALIVLGGPIAFPALSVLAALAPTVERTSPAIGRSATGIPAMPLAVTSREHLVSHAALCARDRHRPSRNPAARPPATHPRVAPI